MPRLWLRSGYELFTSENEVLPEKEEKEGTLQRHCFRHFKISFLGYSVEIFL